MTTTSNTDGFEAVGGDIIYKQTFATQTSKVARERSLTIVKLVQPFIDELSDLTNNVFHVLSVRILLSVFSNFLRDRFNILENV